MNRMNGMNGMNGMNEMAHFTPQHYARQDINSKNNLKRLYS
jgi:hypothetical protein